MPASQIAARLKSRVSRSRSIQPKVVADGSPKSTMTFPCGKATLL